MNFARDVVDSAPADRLALVELSRAGGRREWRFGEVADGAARMAGTLAAHGVGRGDVVMTLVGNRPEWVMTMIACWRLGAVVLPCNEQLRAKDLALRLEVAQPKVVVVDERNRGELEAAGTGDAIVLLVPDAALWRDAPISPAAELDANDPAVIIFTSGTSGEPKEVIHPQRYLAG